MLSVFLHLAKYLIGSYLVWCGSSPWKMLEETLKLWSTHEIAWKYDAGIIDVIFVPIMFAWFPCVALFSRGMEITLMYTGPGANIKLSNGRNKKPHPPSTFLKIEEYAQLVCWANNYVLCSIYRSGFWNENDCCLRCERTSTSKEKDFLR